MALSQNTREELGRELHRQELERELQAAEQQCDRLLEAVKAFIEAPPSFSEDERLRLWRLAGQIEKEKADAA